jgi:hypothetical protein
MTPARQAEGICARSRQKPALAWRGRYAIQWMIR